MVSLRGVKSVHTARPQESRECRPSGVEWRASNCKCDLTSLLAGLSDGVGEMLLMVSGDVEPNPGPQTLIDAINRGNLPEVERLLSSGEVNVNEWDRQSGGTALILASRHGRLQIVQLLITKGADVNAKDENGQTAVMAASVWGHDSVVRELVDSGAKINNRAMGGETAIMGASYWGHLSVIRYLVEKGADVNFCDQGGTTALDLAMKKGQTDVVEYLSDIRLATFAGELQNPDDPMSRVMTVSDLPALMRVLSNAAYIARQLGIQLDLKPTLVTTLENKASHDPVNVLTLVLDTRLKRTPPQAPLVTLQRLCDVLSNPPISDENLACDLKDYFTPVTTQDPQFPGIRFLGTPWNERVTSEGKEIYWEDSIGVAFIIPPEAVPDGELLRLTIRPCLAGPFELPEQYQLASPSYHISLSGELTKDIQIVLYHSVDLRSHDDCRQMTFLSAPGTPAHDGSQYEFTVVEGGVFHPNERFGTISLRQVCDIAIGTAGPKPPDMYSARLYRNSSSTRAAFCMVPYQPLYTTHLSKYMERMNSEFVKTAPAISEPVKFGAKPKVTLKRPSDTSGYTITSDQDQLEISKEKVDCVFSNSPELPEDYPVRLFLDIHPVGDAPPPGSCQLTAIGLEKELSFELKPQTTSTSDSAYANKLLSVDDLSEVNRKIDAQNVHWYEIGLALRLPLYVLETIERQYTRYDQRLEKMLLEWLKRQSLRPTWQALINALEQQTVGREDAAQDLEKYLESKAAEEASAVKERESEGTPPTAVAGTQRQRKVPTGQATAEPTQTSSEHKASPTAPSSSTVGVEASEAGPQKQSKVLGLKGGGQATAEPVQASNAPPTAPPTGALNSQVWTLVLVGLLVTLPLAILIVYLK